MKNMFIKPVLSVRSFVDRSANREAYREIFHRILLSWEGNFKQCLEGILDDKIRQTVIMNIKDTDLRLYIKEHLPFMCSNAKKARGLYQQDITLFIFSFI